MDVEGFVSDEDFENFKSRINSIVNALQYDTLIDGKLLNKFVNIFKLFLSTRRSVLPSGAIYSVLGSKIRTLDYLIVRGYLSSFKEGYRTYYKVDYPKKSLSKPAEVNLNNNNNDVVDNVPSENVKKESNNDVDDFFKDDDGFFGL